MRTRKAGGRKAQIDSSPSAPSVQLSSSSLTKNQKKKRRQKLGQLSKRSKAGERQVSDLSESSCTPSDGLAAEKGCFASTEICSLNTGDSQCSTVTEAGPLDAALSGATAASASAASSQQEEAISDAVLVDAAVVQQAAAEPAGAGGSLQQQDFSASAQCISLALQLSAASCPDETEQLKSKRNKRQYAHGNYHAYYGYRLGAELDEDPRLHVRLLHVLLLCKVCTASLDQRK